MITHDQIRDELLRRLAARQLSGKAVAELLGIAPARITEIRKGDRRIQLAELEILAKFFGMEGGNDSEREAGIIWVPVIGIAAAGGWQEAISLPEYKIPLLKKAGTNQAFAVEVDGDSMNLILPERCWAVIDPDQKALYDRKSYLIANGNGEATIKRYRDNPARFEPVSNNPDHKPLDIGQHQITVIGRVVSYGSDEGL